MKTSLVDVSGRIGSVPAGNGSSGKRGAISAPAPAAPMTVSQSRRESRSLLRSDMWFASEMMGSSEENYAKDPGAATLPCSVCAAGTPQAKTLVVIATFGPTLRYIPSPGSRARVAEWQTQGTQNPPGGNPCVSSTLTSGIDLQ